MGVTKHGRCQLKYKPYPKRNALRNYFPLPNEIFPPGLASGEIAVYSYLPYCEDRKTFLCYPSYRSIGRAVNLSRNTVRKYVAGLEERKSALYCPTHLGICGRVQRASATKSGRRRQMHDYTQALQQRLTDKA